MLETRTVRWEGFYNARDLGGLPTIDGRITRRGALIRSADLRFVTAAGWQTAFDAGVRTVIDLRNDDEIRPRSLPGPTLAGGSASFAPPSASPVVPPGIDALWVPLDDIEDIEFWRNLNDEQLNGTPLYYQPFLMRKPERCVAAMAAIARARPGGVIFHCGAGRDRTGLVALLVLSLAGVEPSAIADDYELSTNQVVPLFAAFGHDDPTPSIEAALTRRDTTAVAVILDILNSLDVTQHLRAGGLTDADFAALRNRLRE